MARVSDRPLAQYQPPIRSDRNDFRTQGGVGRLSDAVAIDELKMLSAADDVLLPEDLAADALDAHGTQFSSLDALEQFPAPPLRPSSGEEVFRALGRVAISRVPSFPMEHTSSPMSGAERAEAAGQAIALLRGILGLERKIRERM